MSGFSQQLKAATIDSIAGLFQSRKMLVMFILGYSSGLPLMLTASSLTYWYHEAGISIQDIGLLTLAALPYTIKYLCSPVIDRISFKHFGRRKGWIFFNAVIINRLCVFIEPFLTCAITINYCRHCLGNLLFLSDSRHCD